MIHKFSLVISTILMAGCVSPFKMSELDREQWPVGDYFPFKIGHEIPNEDPSMYEIVYSLNFLWNRGVNPFEVSDMDGEYEAGRVWIDSNWVDLGEGEGDDAVPVVVEKLQINPVTIKVIKWSRIMRRNYDGASYLIPFHRFEYQFVMDQHGWRKIISEIKTGPKSLDRKYPYDERSETSGRNGRVIRRHTHALYRPKC
jgi:hypothetical protein